MLNPLFYMQSIGLAIGQIWANKVRSALTALGIIIGVASVSAVIAALTGLKAKVLTEFERIGASKMFIVHDFPPGTSRNQYGWEQVRLKPQELQAISEQCKSIKQLTPLTFLGGNVQVGSLNVPGVSGTGIWPAWHDIEDRRIINGRQFTQHDVDHARQVCIINDKAIEELRLDSDPVNSHLLFNNRRFLIVGVVENKREGLFGGGFGANSSAAEIFLPFTTAAKMQSPNFFFMIMAQITSPDVADEAQAEVRFLLRRMRNLKPDEPNTFEAQPLDQFINQFKALAAGITAIAGGIVAISLLVGGIGIMNIMLVAVSERTREIGLRKAVGATPKAILMQFLLEAVTLSVMGGLIGVGLGEAFAFGLTQIPDAGMEQATVPMWAVALAFAFSACVGVIFGMFPAIKAARLNPIDALRHE